MKLIIERNKEGKNIENAVKMNFYNEKGEEIRLRGEMYIKHYNSFIIPIKVNAMNQIFQDRRINKITYELELENL